MAGAGEFARIARFLAVGVLNTFVGLGVIYSCKYFGQLSDVSANVVGYVVGVTNSFFWNRRWTFVHSGSIFPAALRFLGVFLAAYLANLATVMILIEAFDVNSYLAQALGTAPYTALFYLGSRFFVFTR